MLEGQLPPMPFCGPFPPSMVPCGPSPTMGEIPGQFNSGNDGGDKKKCAPSPLCGLVAAPPGVPCPHQCGPCIMLNVPKCCTQKKDHHHHKDHHHKDHHHKDYKDHHHHRDRSHSHHRRVDYDSKKCKESRSSHNQDYDKHYDRDKHHDRQEYDSKKCKESRSSHEHNYDKHQGHDKHRDYDKHGKYDKHDQKKKCKDSYHHRDKEEKDKKHDGHKKRDDDDDTDDNIDLAAEVHRRKKLKGMRKVRSRELRAGILYRGCDCDKRNGLQDDCPRTGCKGSPECLTRPATCPPSQYSNAKHLTRIMQKNLEKKKLQCKDNREKMKKCDN